jgi:histidinol-phosphatase (PHP family)
VLLLSNLRVADIDKTCYARLFDIWHDRGDYIIRRTIADMHCHSRFSADGHDDIDRMCESARAKNLTYIAFTEHLDYHPRDMGYGFFKETQYLAAIAEASARLDGRLGVLSGVEFGEPHLYPREFCRVNSLPLDAIAAGVHMLGDNFLGDADLLERHSISEIYEIYYQTVLETVRFGGFDVLVHLGLPKRNYGVSLESSPVVDEILREMISKDIALEVNTSPLRKGCRESVPDAVIASKFASLGGRKITIGSDAHSAEEIAADFPYALGLIQSLNAAGASLVVGHFEKRSFKTDRELTSAEL